MRPKRIDMPDGSIIIDGLSRLIVIEKNVAQDWEKHDIMASTMLCKANFFITKKGREAVQIAEGDTHYARIHFRCGDKTWGLWESRRIVNGLFSEAKATSNGGGCWFECQIWDVSTNPITSIQQSYIDEL